MPQIDDEVNFANRVANATANILMDRLSIGDCRHTRDGIVRYLESVHVDPEIVQAIRDKKDREKERAEEKARYPVRD